MVLVDPAARGRGVATALLQRGLRLAGADATARLDATPVGRTDLSRARVRQRISSGPVVSRRQAAAHRPPIRRAAARGSGLAGDSRDGRCASSARRARHCSNVLPTKPRSTRGFCSPTASSRGYLFGRHGYNREQLGPLVADSDDTAIALLRSCLAEHPDRAFFIDVPDGQRGLGARALDAGVRNRAAVCADASRRHDGARTSVLYLCHHRSGVRLSTAVATSRSERSACESGAILDTLVSFQRAHRESSSPR